MESERMKKTEERLDQLLRRLDAAVCYLEAEFPEDLWNSLTRITIASLSEIATEARESTGSALLAEKNRIDRLRR